MTSEHIAAKKDQTSIFPGGASSGRLGNRSLDYTDNHVDKDLHPALSDSGIYYNPEIDIFSAEFDAAQEDETLFSCQQAFKNELQQYVEFAGSKHNTERDLISTQTWDDVMTQAERARREYKGADKKGIVKNMHDGLRNFTTTFTPAIEAWLRLLPSTSTYGSVFCGGITIILEVCCIPSFRDVTTAECL